MTSAETRQLLGWQIGDAVGTNICIDCAARSCKATVWDVHLGTVPTTNKNIPLHPIYDYELIRGTICHYCGVPFPGVYNLFDEIERHMRCTTL